MALAVASRQARIPLGGDKPPLELRPDGYNLRISRKRTMNPILAGIVAAALVLLSVPAFRWLGRFAPRLLYAQPFIMIALSGAAAAMLSSAIGLPLLVCGIISVLVALPTGYWGCRLMLDEFLRDVRF